MRARVAAPRAAAAAEPLEASVLIAPHPVYVGDEGVVVVGGRTEPVADSGGGGGGSARSMPLRSRHYDYFAFEGRGGASRWSHRAGDFHAALHGDQELTPQMDYRLDLQALGGVEGGADGRHAGERPWRDFKESLLAELPYAWRHAHDGTLGLASFSRSRRAPHAERVARAAASHSAAASGAAALRTLGASSSSPPAPAATAEPNVVVAKRRNGIEALHLYSGRPLTAMPLADARARGRTALVADINGDLQLDHLQAMPDGGAAPRAADDGEPEQYCTAVATSGLPAREVLWEANLCGGREAVRSSRAQPPHDATAPVALRRRDGSRKLDSVFAVASGRVTCVGADGRVAWSVATEAGWRATHAAGDADAPAAPFASLTLLEPAAGADPLIALLGEKRAVLLSTDGAIVATTELPAWPVAPPTVADFDGDGIADLVVPTRSGHVGLRLEPSAASLLVQIVFGVAAVGVAVTAYLRHAERAEDDTKRA